MTQTTLRLLFFPLFILLNGCFGGTHYAPVIERQERASVVPNTHTVVRSETLYSIAWHYNLEFRGLASTNNISAPYTIYPGQVLRLKPRPTMAKTASGRKQSRPSNTAAVRQKTAAKTPRSTSVATTTTSPLPSNKKQYPFRWQWPAKGKVTRSYSAASAVHKGIDIQGKLGESVRAANSGKVVYAGSGLVGYGKLLIIKHDERYLSAYGHNRKLMVNEGELVKVGQKIAELGNTGTDKVKLHFEIRRDGKPVNPLGLLPGK